MAIERAERDAKASQGPYPAWRQNASGLWVPNDTHPSASSAALPSNGLWNNQQPAQDVTLGVGIEAGEQVLLSQLTPDGDATHSLTSRPRLLPGPAAVRRARSDEDHDRAIARLQMVMLLVVLLVVALLSFKGYERIAYKSPPYRQNADRPSYEVTAPGKIDRMSFEINGLSTTIKMSLSHSEPKGSLTIASTTGDEIVILGATAQGSNGESIRSDGWERITDKGSPEMGPRYVQLVPRIASPPTQVSLTLKNGSLTTSSQFQFLRTRRIDVVGTEGVAESAEGVVAVETGAYAIERFVTGGVSRPGPSEGSITRYSVSSKQVFGANSDALPVPAVSIDLADVERERGRDPNLLILGTILGVAGGLVIEIMLTTIHLLAAPFEQLKARFFT